MSEGSDDGMTKAERLALAAAEAPILRNASEKTLNRRVGRLDKDGNVVGYTSGREVLKGLAKAQELEHAVDGKRPKLVICENCGKSFAIPSKGKVPTTCTEGCLLTCSVRGCRGRVAKRTAVAAAKHRRAAKCKKCAVSKSLAKMHTADAKEKSLQSRQNMPRLTRERRAQRLRESQSHQQRSENVRRGMAAMTEASRAAMISKSRSARSADERSASARRWLSKKTSKELRERALKAAATRLKTHRRVTHCKRGHEYDEANTQCRADGSFYCKACEKQRRRNSLSKNQDP